MDSEEIILKRLENIANDVGEIKEDLVEIRTYQKTHYSKLQSHSTRLSNVENKVQNLEVKISKSDVYVGIACFLGGAVVVGGIQFLFTQVLS